MLSGKKFFWDPDRCGYWEFLVKCVLGFRICHIGMVLDILGGEADGVHGWKKVGWSIRDPFSPLAIRVESEERIQQVVSYIAVIETKRLDMRRGSESKDLKLPSIPCWPTCFSRHCWWVPREFLLELGTGIRG